MSVRIEPLSTETIAGAIALQRECYPLPFPAELLWQPEHLAQHIKVFPMGQFVAMSDETVVGSSSTLIISEENWLSRSDWETTTGGHFMKNHDPNGKTLYGMDISVHPDFRGIGVGKALYQVRFDLVQSLGLTRFGTACRIPGLRRWLDANYGDALSYCLMVANGELTDRTLTPLLRYGLRFVHVIENYMDDEESCNCTALLEWDR
ncbi:MAG: GNAT family N-acetyltransferase [Fimbriimonadaceae bacterium]|nr:GNAT family N-acetyltransferase [Fimbriimonadaceae bacterium]